MKILVLAGGFDQIALIQELKKRGHLVYLADYFQDPPAKKYADRHFQVSTLDEEAIYNLVVDNTIDLLTTACTDQALMTVASVSEKLHKPCYISAEVARNVTNKAFMKKKFLEYNIPTSSWVLLEDSFDNSLFVDFKGKYPLIVKPCDCNSSKGVIKVSNNDELIFAIKQAFSLSRSKKVIVEEFKDGQEVSIDVWKDKENAKILSVSSTNKIDEKCENFTIYQSQYPIDISDALMKKIQNVAKKICDAFELDNCPLLIQAIIKDDNINVIEISARMGGGSKYKLIEYISGIKIMEVYVNRVLGDTNQIVHPHLTDKKVEINYVCTLNGIVNKIIGFEDLLEKGEIKEIFQYRNQGCITEKMTTSSDRVLGFLIEADTVEDLQALRSDIVKSVDIKNEFGQSIMYKKCFYSEC